MELFQQYLTDLREVVQLLSAPFLRERFMATCLNSPEANLRQESPDQIFVFLLLFVQLVFLLLFVELA